MPENLNIRESECPRVSGRLRGVSEAFVRSGDDRKDSHQAPEERFAMGALSQAMGSSERADPDRSEFLAIMSHEVRTPMNGVLGYADLLKTTELNAQQLEFVETICSSGESLMLIINDILDLWKYESEQFKLTPSRFDLRKCIDEAVKLCETAINHQVTFRLSIDEHVPDFINADASQVKQILVNLISNALKFTPAGLVELKVEKGPLPPGSKPEDCLLTFAITDTGIGIPHEKISSLFKPFGQVDASSTRKYGGTGLGLAICKKLVSLMNGEIHVESTPGVGSTFRFTLLVQLVAAHLKNPPVPHQQASSVKSDSLRILIVEDIKMNQLLALRLLSTLGYQAEVVSTGIECLELLKTKNFDLILMDLHMPGIDGITATRRIRLMEKENAGLARAFICALTANVMARAREACFAAGMDNVLTKPLRMKDLQNMLNSVVGLETQSV
jgi:signal transduction histidine kinase/CheY-like chemotaxis protein